MAPEAICAPAESPSWQEVAEQLLIAEQPTRCVAHISYYSEQQIAPRQQILDSHYFPSPPALFCIGSIQEEDDEREAGGGGNGFSGRRPITYTSTFLVHTQGFCGRAIALRRWVLLLLGSASCGNSVAKRVNKGREVRQKGFETHQSSP